MKTRNILLNERMYQVTRFDDLPERHRWLIDVWTLETAKRCSHLINVRNRETRQTLVDMFYEMEAAEERRDG